MLFWFEKCVTWRSGASSVKHQTVAKAINFYYFYFQGAADPFRCISSLITQIIKEHFVPLDSGQCHFYSLGI